jgi:hypothetical protein
VTVSTATSAGHADRPNEDFVGAVAGALVVVDGAGIRGAEHLCQHGVAWYAAALGAEILDRAKVPSPGDLRDAVGEAIKAVTASHSTTCSVADPSSPQASVAVVRLAANRVEYLVLGDAYVVVEAASPLVITDGREVAVREAATERLRTVSPGTTAHDEELRRAIETLRSQRNHPGGYWIAKDDPRAARAAVVGSIDLRPDQCVAVLSNGAARLVEPYRVSEWEGLFDMLHAGGPETVLQRLRAEEERVATEPDDASVAYLRRAR